MSSQFEKFLDFCESHLTSSKEILKLAWKRYKECNEEYRNSETFSELILVTESKISSNKHRIFVHLRDFLQHLKENKYISDGSNKRRLCGSSSEPDSDSNPPKRRRTIKNSTDTSKYHFSGTHSEYKDDSSQHDEVNHVNITEYAEESDNSSRSSLWHCKQGPSKQELDSEKDDSDSRLSTNVPSAACTKMYSSSEEDNDKDIETIKHIRDIIECNSDDNASDHNSGNKNKLNIRENLHSDDHEEVSGFEENKNDKDADIISLSKDHSIHFRKNQINGKNISLNQREIVDSNLDSEGCDEKGKACTDVDIESDSSLEFCSVNLKPSIEKSVSDRVIDYGENTKQTSLYNEESDSDVHMIVSDHEDDTSKPNSLVLNKTEDFTYANGAIDDEDCAGYDADKENRKLADRKVVTSSDEEDPAYAEKARKCREKCKKKYVVSTGGKKHQDISQQSGSKVTKTEKLEKSPKKKKVKKRSPKKPSPGKSPIIIVTDSESCSEFEDNIKTVEKKVDEKLITKFKKEFETDVGTPLIVVDKYSSTVKPNLGGNNEESNQCKVELLVKPDLCSPDEDLEKSTKSEELVNSDLGCEVDIDKTDETNKNEDNHVNIKRRVDLVTEEKFEKKDVVVKDHNGDYFESVFKKKTKDRLSDSDDNTGRTDDGIEQPKPSTTSCSDSKKKKASNKQIKKLEQLLESIRNQIENVRNRELDLDDLDSDISDYILEDKLQRKFMKVWNKLCELHQAVKTTGRPTDKYFRYEGTRYPDINRKIEKFINKRKAFPDYHDIRSVIIKVNKDKRLHLRHREIDDLSKEAFTDVGNQLQKRRQKDFVSTFHMPGAEVNAFSLYDDPALYDPDLKKKLDTNKKAAKNKMDQVVEKYAQLQYQVDDKTDDDDGDDDDDEDDDEENADPNTGTEDNDQLISGVDNSDSDINDDNMFDDNNGLDPKINETSPCLEIENLENGWKSTFHPNLPQHKVGRSSPDLEPEKHKCAKSQHFSEVLGLSVSKKKPEITILSDNDDDNEVKCDGSTFEDVPSDIEDEPKETYEKTISTNDITIITDDEEDEYQSLPDEPLELKIKNARHVSINDLEKVHKEGICSDMEESVDDSKDLEEVDDFKDLEEVDGDDCLKSGSEAAMESLPDIETGDTSTSIETLPVKVEAVKSDDKVLEDIKNSTSENRNNEPDLDVICIEKNNFESKLSLSSEHMPAKCSSKVIHPVSKLDHQTNTSPEIVCLDTEESVIPSHLSTKENKDGINTSKSKDVINIASNSLPENSEDVELIEDDDDVLSEVSEMEDSDTGSIMVATALKNPLAEDTDFDDINDDNNENIQGELNEDLVNGGSDSISDVFASYENEGDMETECDRSVESEPKSQDTVCQEMSVDESLSNSDDEVEEVNNEENDQLNNTSSCDIETIASKNMKHPNVKSKLLKLGTAITSQPSLSQDSITQGSTEVINLSEPSTSRWNDYDENAGIIETYEEPAIHVMPINHDNVIVVSDSE